MCNFQVNGSKVTVGPSRPRLASERQQGVLNMTGT